MAYRHLLLLGRGRHGGAQLDHVDLGPARVDARIGDRVLDYLRGADRLVETTLAPAALLAARFGLLPEGTDAVELDTLLGYFYRLPRLPKLAGAHVLRAALVEGVAKGLFGLASGSSWNADDAVLRFGEPIDPSEIQFQPGTFLVRAATMRALLAKRGTDERDPQARPSGAATTMKPDDGRSTAAEPEGRVSEPRPSIDEGGGTPSVLSKVTVHVKAIPGSKARDVVKVAVLPLGASSSDVTVEMTIRADGGLAGISRETLNLVVLEGLRQLGLTEVEVDAETGQ